MQAGKKSKWNATGALKNDNYLFIQVENFLKSFMSDPFIPNCNKYSKGFFQISMLEL